MGLLGLQNSVISGPMEMIKPLMTRWGNEHEKIKLVELSRQSQMMWSRQPMKLTHDSFPYPTWLSILYNWLRKYLFYTSFLNVWIPLRSLLDSKFESWNQVIMYFPHFLNILPTIQIKKVFLLCVYRLYVKMHIFTDTQFGAWPGHWLPISISWISFHMDL